MQGRGGSSSPRSDANLRALTVLLSIGVVLVSYWFASGYMESKLVGLLTALAVGLKPHWIALSVLGLREELYTILIVMLAYSSLVTAPRLASRDRLWGLTVATAGAALLRLSSLVVWLSLILYALWKRRLILHRALLPVSVTLALLIPHFVYERRQTGDWLGSANIHAAWYRNHEFVMRQKVGCPGCPSEEELPETPTLVLEQRCCSTFSDCTTL